MWKKCGLLVENTTDHITGIKGTDRTYIKEFATYVRSEVERVVIRWGLGVLWARPSFSSLPDAKDELIGWGSLLFNLLFFRGGFNENCCGELILQCTRVVRDSRMSDVFPPKRPFGYGR